MRIRSTLFAAPIAVAAAALLLAAAAPSAQAATPRSRLAAEIAKALRGSGATHLDYSIRVQHVGTIKHGAATPTAPASNEKLFTTMTALQDLGPQYRYATVVSGTAAISGHVLPGSLVLRGAGDPTLATSDLLALARRLHAKGLRRVSGHLIVDDSRYSHQTVVAGWKHSFVPEETGTVDAFSVNGNEWRGGAAFNADPTPDNAKLWRRELKKAHITVAGTIEVRRAPAGLHTLATHHSSDIAAIIDETLTQSVNFYAEMMLRELGVMTSRHGTAAAGVAAERTLASAWDLPFGKAYDGSGLSYSDRETPATIQAWLSKFATVPNFSHEYYALPASCRTGTLEHRLCGPHVAGLVRAKTGTLNHVSALSGYVTAESGDHVVFSILASGFSDKKYQRVYNHVDAAVAALRRNG